MDLPFIWKPLIFWVQGFMAVIKQYVPPKRNVPPLAIMEFRIPVSIWGSSYGETYLPLFEAIQPVVGLSLKCSPDKVLPQEGSGWTINGGTPKHHQEVSFLRVKKK